VELNPHTFDRRFRKVNMRDRDMEGSIYIDNRHRRNRSLVIVTRQFRELNVLRDARDSASRLSDLACSSVICVLIGMSSADGFDLFWCICLNRN
jgi:hypothetical protein